MKINLFMNVLLFKFHINLADLLSMQTIDYDQLTKSQKKQFRRIKELPNCQYLYCWNNQLTVLPELSICQELHCSDNQLTVLPELPNCQTLICRNNQLTVLPGPALSTTVLL